MIDFTPPYSVCVPVGEQWAEMSAHATEVGGRAALGLQLMTAPDAALWDWAANKIIAGGAS